MAQQAVFSVMERIGSIAVDEAKYLWGVSNKLETAKKQLLRIQAFLSDLDDKMLRGGAMARNLVSEVREVTYEVEDVIDTAKILKRQSDPNISITGAISKYAGFPIYLSHLHKLGARIDSATARMKTIFEDFERYNIAATAITEEPRVYNIDDEAIQHWRSVQADFGKQLDVIGFDDQIEQIKNDLLDRHNEHMTFVSIIGPGGAGKSTMAKKVYDLAEVKTHFEVHAWLTISQRVLSRGELLKELVKGLVSHHTLDGMIKHMIGDEEAQKAKDKKVRELKTFVPHHLLEEVLQRIMEDEKAKEAKKLGPIPLDVLEEKIKHAIEDWKAQGSEDAEKVKYLLEEWINRILTDKKRAIAKVNEVERLGRFVHHHLLEEVLIKHIIEDKKAKKAYEFYRYKSLQVLEERIKDVVKDLETKDLETKQTKVKYLLEELVCYAIQLSSTKKAEEDKESNKAEVNYTESKEVEVKRLMQVLIKRSMEDEKANVKTVKLDELKLEQLMVLLQKFALSKRYLVVLDDIWSTDALDLISVAFPEMKNGSRVILTTRNEVVARHQNARKKIYKPKLLNEEESTKLLLNTALPEHILGGRNDNPAATGENLDELKKLGKDLAVKCCGLPLAIVVLGGHLSRHLDVTEWKRLTCSMDWHALIATDRIIGAILDLSYYDMSSNMRSCFLYTTAFPEDYLIDVLVLTNIWVAEGFIPLVRGYTREELAVHYVTELAQRCMIQVEKKVRSGRITVIKVHDILRDWGIGRARREGLMKDCHHAEDVEATYSEEIIAAYRMALHGKVTRKVDVAMKQLRTILDFELSHMTVMANSLWSLRVLYISGTSGTVSVPKEIGLMKYLRYLCLGREGRYCLPSSIGDLLSLETFHATGHIEHIPSSLWKILTLRRVYASDADSWSVPQISSKSKLQVVLVKSRLGQRMLIRATNQQIQRNKNPGLSCFFVHVSQNQMVIVGRCKEGPRSPSELAVFEGWDAFEAMKICCTNLLGNQEILELGWMNCLKYLELGNRSYTGSVMTFLLGSFPSLIQLVIHDLAVDSWRLEPDSMMSLRHLTLCKCPNLIELPKELLCCQDLVKLNLIAMPSSCEQGTVPQALKEKGRAVVHISSNEKDFCHLNFAFHFEA